MNITLDALKSPLESEFSRPHFPNGFPANKSCGWYIKAPANHIIELQFKQAWINYDNVQVFDVFDKDGSERSLINLPRFYPKVVSRSQIVFISFKNNKSYKISYKAFKPGTVEWHYLINHYINKLWLLPLTIVIIFIIFTTIMLIIVIIMTLFAKRFSAYLGRQCGRVAEALDLKYGDSRFKSPSDHWQDLVQFQAALVHTNCTCPLEFLSCSVKVVSSCYLYTSKSTSAHGCQLSTCLSSKGYCYYLWKSDIEKHFIIDCKKMRQHVS